MVITLACLLAFMVAIAAIGTLERVVFRGSISSTATPSTLPTSNFSVNDYASQGNTLSSKGATESVERYNDLEKPIGVSSTPEVSQPGT